ncbi:MAG: PKD domain-containing protein [Candidatus Bipolaricaulota bacterium]|nr:MAG: PKD domain-containing protein [Candidatus Bipolaricaulota bacterium]
MTRALATILTTLLAASLVAAAQVEVLHPNAGYFAANELEVLLPAINRLTSLLSASDYASGRWYPDQWTSVDFAAYSQGILAAEGFASTLVAADGWPDGRHVWLLVEVPLAGKIVWVPVEALPEPGHAQRRLGRVPLWTDGAGVLWYEDAYGRYDDVLDLSENVPPLPVIGATPLRGSVGHETTFFGLHSRDSDGEIVLWFWDFGDGAEASGAIADHTFSAERVYTVTLTVYDNRGAHSSVVFSYPVALPRAPTSPGGGCGCGG